VKRTYQWDYYDTCADLDVCAQIGNMVAVLEQLHQGCFSGETGPRIPLQASLKLPAAEGIGLELGDTIALTYTPMFTEVRKFRVEEIKFSARDWQFEVTAHNQMF
jgi:hypothetical protein